MARMIFWYLDSKKLVSVTQAAILRLDVRHQALLFTQGNDRATAWEEALFRGLGDRASGFEKVSRRFGN
jgi:hypothetical protein